MLFCEKCFLKINYKFLRIGSRENINISSSVVEIGYDV